MGNAIHYSTVEYQIEKLISQGLIINDKELAQHELSLYGYTNLIKGYREPYTYIKDGKRLYKPGTTFEQIASLYLLDKNLRNAVMAAMLDLEEHIKEATADVIAESFGVQPDNYLCYRNYLNPKRRKKRFSLAGILDSLKNTLDTDKDPIHYYAEKYNCVPPWVLFKSVYLSTIVNYINLLKKPEKENLAKRLYNISEITIPFDKLPKFMTDTLFVCLDYRNLSAHGARIYDHDNIYYTAIKPTDESVEFHGFSKLLFYLSALNYQGPYEQLNTALSVQLSRHCSQFPVDVSYLEQTLHMNIITAKYVWISGNNKIYHYNKHCSGMTNPHYIELSDAQENDFRPCKRCCKKISHASSAPVWWEDYSQGIC